MRPGRPTSRRWDLAVLMLALIGAASAQDPGPRLCGACGRAVAPDATCCPEPCS